MGYIEPVKVQLSQEHIEAVQRRRRVVVNFDAIIGDGETFATKEIEELVQWKFMYIDDPDSHIDSVWWCWSDGNVAPYPSKILPLHPPEFSQWIEAGLDIVRIFLDETKKRGLEAFFSHRINGGDDDFYADPEGQGIIPLKQQHPEWTMPMPWGANVWNFLHEGVRDYSLSILEEVARSYDFDGIELDWQRHAHHLPVHHAFRRRYVLTDFMRQARQIVSEAGKRRGRPLWLAARVAASREACLHVGYDVEKWVAEGLIDYLIPSACAEMRQIFSLNW